MKLQYEPLLSEQLTADLHVRDLTTTDRHEAKRRLDFITAKLGNEALKRIDLGLGE